MKKETEVFILSIEEKELLKTMLNNIILHTKKDKEAFISKTQFMFSPEGVKRLKNMAKILA